MPTSKYFGGRGAQVMDKMKKRYGPEEGKGAFYATANKQGQTPPEDKKKPKRGFGGRRPS